MSCTHKGLIEYDPSVDEYYCVRCGDTVDKPEGYDE